MAALISIETDCSLSLAARFSRSMSSSGIIKEYNLLPVMTDSSVFWGRGTGFVKGSWAFGAITLFFEGG
jgi:hypothetical protein